MNLYTQSSFTVQLLWIYNILTTTALLQLSPEYSAYHAAASAFDSSLYDYFSLENSYYRKDCQEGLVYDNIEFRSFVPLPTPPPPSINLNCFCFPVNVIIYYPFDSVRCMFMAPIRFLANAIVLLYLHEKFKAIFIVLYDYYDLIKDVLFEIQALSFP